MPRVVYDPSVSSIVVDLLLEAADGKSSLLIPVVLDTGASLTIVATDIMARLGYDPANPSLARQRIVMGSGVEYAPRATVRYRPLPSGKRSPIWKSCATTYPQRAALTVFLDSIF
jgi:hypothetical protein